jgi:hypothetical protein
MGNILSMGNNSKGRSAVTEMETASVIHQINIHTATEITASPFSETSSTGKLTRIRKAIGPRKSPSFLLSSIEVLSYAFLGKLENSVFISKKAPTNVGLYMEGDITIILF